MRRSQDENSEEEQEASPTAPEISNAEWDAGSPAGKENEVESDDDDDEDGNEATPAPPTPVKKRIGKRKKLAQMRMQSARR